MAQQSASDSEVLGAAKCIGQPGSVWIVPGMAKSRQPPETCVLATSAQASATEARELASLCDVILETNVIS
jgi:hypothetical protein